MDKGYSEGGIQRVAYWMTGPLKPRLGVHLTHLYDVREKFGATQARIDCTLMALESKKTLCFVYLFEMHFPVVLMSWLQRHKLNSPIDESGLRVPGWPYLLQHPSMINPLLHFLAKGNQYKLSGRCCWFEAFSFQLLVLCHFGNMLMVRSETSIRYSMAFMTSLRDDVSTVLVNSVTIRNTQNRNSTVTERDTGQPTNDLNDGYVLRSLNSTGAEREVDESHPSLQLPTRKVGGLLCRCQWL
ncbi:hypothetical protein WG66_003581 [Moniliophthora roreri]|nr:hypothetical protein WG66_003581 [Moniliophthora roreri]